MPLMRSSLASPCRLRHQSSETRPEGTKAPKPSCLLFLGVLIPKNNVWDCEVTACAYNTTRNLETGIGVLRVEFGIDRQPFAN